MSQLDVEILRYEEKLLNAVKKNLPEAIIQQYNLFLSKKLLARKLATNKLH